MKKLLSILLTIVFISFQIIPVVNAVPGEQTPMEIGDTTIDVGFYEYLPEDYDVDPNKEWPLVIFLHGSGECGNGTTDLSKVLINGPPKNIKNGADYEFICISPQMHTDWWHNPDGTSNYKGSVPHIDEVVEYAKSQYRVDEDRIYVTGLSLGGVETWYYGAEYPDKVAAIVPVCGPDIIATARAALVDTPIWAFHNWGDDKVSSAKSISICNRIAGHKLGSGSTDLLSNYPGTYTSPGPSANCDATRTASFSVDDGWTWTSGVANTADNNLSLTLYNSISHDAWSATYTNQKMWDWLLAQSKSEPPPIPTPTPTPTPTPKPEILNLALNKTTATSSYQFNNPIYLGSKAVDGDATTTRWSSDFSDPQWISIDLGEQKTINNVKLRWEAGCATSYKIQVSNDNTNWEDVYSETSGDGGLDDIFFTPVNARYVRMEGIQRVNIYWGYSLWEFEVYNMPAPNLALNKTTATSSNESSNVVGSKAVDGDIITTNSRWSSGYSDNQWISIDLGEQKLINNVKLRWEHAYGKSYKIQVSDDNINWEDVYSETSGNGAWDDISFEPTNARYVKMQGIQRGTIYGYSLWEFEVYAAPAPNIALNKTATQSSFEYAMYNGSKAVDGDVTTTRWSSQFSDPQWISVDLAQAYNIGNVKLRWEVSYGKTYKIQVSNDNVNWIDIYSTDAGKGNGGVDDISFPSVNARYVKMYGTQRGTIYGYSLWEFEVYPE